MNKITFHLWFDTQAKEAAEFYTKIFPDSKIKTEITLEDTPSGTVNSQIIDLCGQEFYLLSAGPYFKFNPSISFMVACKTVEEVQELWAQLSEGGKILMELGEYDFSKQYGWIEDKYGVSWQISQSDDESKQRITPTLLFVGDVCGKAEEAMNFYTSVFDDSELDESSIFRYSNDDGPNKEGTVKYGPFKISGVNFTAMDSAADHKFSFSEAISFMVYCNSQEEIDYFWEKLSAVPEAEQCGWLKDQFGVSWQIVTPRLDEMTQSEDKEKVSRVTKAFLSMKKFDLAELERAFEGE